MYQAVNRIHERLGVAAFYVVANASAYAYLDDRRLVSPAGETPASGGDVRMAFTRFANAPQCPSYAEWPFGLRNRRGYPARLTDSTIKAQAAGRPVTYLLSQFDVVAPSGFFGSCAASAQGTNRFVRGMAFAQYMTEFGQAPHKAIVVDGCSHDARCVYTSEDALPVLFRKPE